MSPPQQYPQLPSPEPPEAGLQPATRTHLGWRRSLQRPSSYGVSSWWGPLCPQLLPLYLCCLPWQVWNADGWQRRGFSWSPGVVDPKMRDPAAGPPLAGSSITCKGAWLKYAEPTEGRKILFWDLAIALPLNLVLEDCGLFWALTWRKGLGLRERCEKSSQPSVESWGESRQEKRDVQDICKHAVVHTGND